MNRESLNKQLQYSSKIDNNSKLIYSKEYLIKEDIKTRRTKCAFISLNVFYMIIALLILSCQFAIIFYNLELGFNPISVSWTTNGAALLIVSVTGIVASCRYSEIWTNIYSILMIITFAMQLTTAYFGYISASENFVRNTLQGSILSSESFKPSADAMDLIQTTFQCCGVDGAHDWGNIWKYNLYNHDYTNERFQKYKSSALKTPQSCCASGSGYQNLRCDNYLKNGCYKSYLQIVMTIIYYAALAIASVQIIGIVSAPFATKTFCRIKSYNGRMTYAHG